MRFTPTLLVTCLLALSASPAALALRFTDDDFDMPVAQIGVAYSKQFHGGAGCGPALPYQYRILSGTLPPGIALDETGVFSGTPTRAGSWSFWVELSDQDPPTASWCVPKQSQREFTITVAPSALTAELTRPYQQTLPGTGWLLADGSSLPAGLTLDPKTGTISGEPTSAESSPVDFIVTNSYGFKHTVEIGFTVAPQLTIATETLQTARARHAYSGRLVADGGVAPFVWKIVHGTLPAGIRLNSMTGVLAGKARRNETRRLTVQVSDRLRAISTRELVIKVVR
jgi:large repetitive protein